MAHYEYTCCTPGCGGLICFTETQDKKLRRTHEWWECPFGHRQHFSAETGDERTIRELRADVQRLRNQIGWRDDEIEHLRAERWHCRWSGCKFEGANETGLRTHMRAAHGMPTLALVRSEEAS